MARSTSVTIACVKCSQPAIEWCEMHTEWFCLVCLFAHPCPGRTRAIRQLGLWGEALLIVHRINSIADVARDAVIFGHLSIKQASRAWTYLLIHARAFRALAADRHVRGHARYELLRRAMRRTGLARDALRDAVEAKTGYITRRHLGHIVHTRGHHFVRYICGIPEPWRLYA